MPFDQQGCAQDQIVAATDVRDDENPFRLYVGLFLLVAAWGISVFMFGLPGLYIPAVIATPVMFVAVIRITLG